MTQNPKKMKGKNKTNFMLKLSEVNRINTGFGIEPTRMLISNQDLEI